MTLNEATIRYADKYFIFMFKEHTQINPDDELGYVLYDYDKRNESSSIPREELKNKYCAFSHGDFVEPAPQIGGVYVVQD
jgi:hypothetical protein